MSGTRGMIIDLETAGLGEHDAGLLHELHGGLEDVPDAVGVRLLEAPGHEIPGLAGLGEISGLEPGGGDAGVAEVVSGKKIDRQFRLFWHHCRI